MAMRSDDHPMSGRDQQLAAANRKLGWILFGIFAGLAAFSIGVVLYRAANR
jgi:hypothetical protein